MSDQWGFETKQIHVGGDPDPTTGARAVPIYQTTLRVPRHRARANLFALAEVGNIYTRIMNPTQGALEARINALEGGIATAIGIPGALAVSSGQAAETLAILTSPSRATTSSSASLYGGTYNLFHYTLPKMGIEVTFVDDPDDLDAVAAAIRRTPRRSSARCSPTRRTTCSTSRASPRRPRATASRSSSTTPCHAVPHPADRVGRRHRRALASPSSSAVTAPRSAARSSTAAPSTTARGRFPNFTEPDPSYHGLAYWPALGHGSFILKARVQLLRDIGMAISPFNAFLILQGLETLSLRMERHWRTPSGRRVPRGHATGRVGRLRRPAVEPVARAGQEATARQGLRLGARLRDQGRAARRASASSRRSSCTATSPTSATSAAW
jgi:O-acetylhomoserine (thiol)-lyase